MFSLMYNAYKYATTYKERPVTFCMLGLDNAGKTCLVSCLKGERPNPDTVATVGYKNVTHQVDVYKVNMIDLGGGARVRSLWKHYLRESYAIIYVLDSSDLKRLPESRRELLRLFTLKELEGKPYLILCNKQDKDGAVPPGQLEGYLLRGEVIPGVPSDEDGGGEGGSKAGESPSVPNHINVVGCAALAPGDGVDPAISKGLKWLLSTVGKGYEERRRDIEAAVEAQKKEEAEKKEATRREIAAKKAAREAAAAAAAAAGGGGAAAATSASTSVSGGAGVSGRPGGTGVDTPEAIAPPVILGNGGTNSSQGGKAGNQQPPTNNGSTKGGQSSPSPVAREGSGLSSSAGGLSAPPQLVKGASGLTATSAVSEEEGSDEYLSASGSVEVEPA